MLIEIVANDSDVRLIRNRETGEVRSTKQVAYADIGQAYPQKQVSTRKETSLYSCDRRL